LKNKYVIFKDDDAGKDFNKLKKWVDVVLEHDAKGAIGLIGKYMKNQQLREFLNSLDPNKIEIFCHGYSHSYLPFFIRKKFGKNRFFKIEFDKSFQAHDKSLKKYRAAESKYLKKMAITFGPPGNLWNDNAPKALVQNGFKLMFSGEKVCPGIFTIFINNNFKQNSLDEFIKDYDKNKNNELYVLQFHHANLSDKQFELMIEVIDFLKNKEGRAFVTPTEFLDLSKKEKI
jgi:peptidoglycan/xylan/chitin deacetylase (PgdA/CDA1 family)